MAMEIMESLTTYLLLIEGVYLIIAIFEGVKKYEQFRVETYALLSEQWWFSYIFSINVDS